MWRTPSGNGVLRGSEAKLFARGVLRLLPELGKDRKNKRASAKAFYRLTRAQQVVILAEVVNAVFRGSVTPPLHTQMNEAAIAAVFDGVNRLIAEEVDDDVNQLGGPVRELVRRVKWHYLEDTDIPWTGEDRLGVWREALDPVMDRILWDRDFEDDPEPNVPVEQQAEWLQMMGIAPGYFGAQVAPTPESVERLLEDWVRSICESIV